MLRAMLFRMGFECISELYHNNLDTILMSFQNNSHTLDDMCFRKTRSCSSFGDYWSVPFQKLWTWFIAIQHQPNCSKHVDPLCFSPSVLFEISISERAQHVHCHPTVSNFIQTYYNTLHYFDCTIHRIPTCRSHMKQSHLLKYNEIPQERCMGSSS